ncbi:MAG: hypothetical protein OXT09_03685 [Myxococcales bacterium]|nr:hypothetical protein [Myxococcales bacterium]
MTPPSFRLASLLLIASLAGCGSSLPKRYVIERDSGDFIYRRYQKTLDVEFVVKGNPAVGHTATYVRRARGNVVAFTSAFVTVYSKARSLTAEVRERVKAMDTYTMSTREIGGGYVWVLSGGDDERWALWVSGKHVIKVGAPEGELLPEEVISDYMALYDSDLTEAGVADEDADSRGPSAKQEREREEEMAMPRHLREGAPR